MILNYFFLESIQFIVRTLRFLRKCTKNKLLSSLLLLLLLLLLLFAISDISYLKTILPATVEEDFYKFLRDIDTSKVTLTSILEGSLVFPKVPLMRLEGPLPGIHSFEIICLILIYYFFIAIKSPSSEHTCTYITKKFVYSLRQVLL